MGVKNDWWLIWFRRDSLHHDLNWASSNCLGHFAPLLMYFSNMVDWISSKLLTVFLTNWLQYSDAQHSLDDPHLIGRLGHFAPLLIRAILHLREGRRVIMSSMSHFLIGFSMRPLLRKDRSQMRNKGKVQTKTRKSMVFYQHPPG